MNRKVIVLNGSPRAAGNTSALVEAFESGTESSGNVVEVFQLGSMDINGCKGCFGGGKDHGSPCVQKDDMDKIYPSYIEADVVVLATPLYYWTISGQLKTAFDRLFAVAECDSRLPQPQKVLRTADGCRGQRFRGERVLVRPP